MMILSTMSLFAQVDFGVRAGLAYSSLVQKVGDTHKSGERLGYSVAGLADIHLYRRFSLRPEVAFTHQGGSWYSGQQISEGMAFHNKCWYYSLQIPVNLAFTFPFFDMHISVYGGPAMDFSLFGKMTSRETNQNLTFGDTEEKDLKPFDLGVNIGFAVEYKKVFFSINTNCGTLDRRSVKREGESRLYQNNVTFSLGYFFRSN